MFSLLLLALVFFALGVRGRVVQGPLWAAGLFLCLHCGFLEGGSMWVGGGHTVGFF